MKEMLTWALENTVMAGVLAVLATGLCIAFRKHPALCHFIWFLVLLRLVAPPVSLEMWPPEKFRETVRNRIGTLVATTAFNSDPRALGRLEPGSDHSLRQGSSASGQSEPDGSAPSRPSFLIPGASAQRSDQVNQNRDQTPAESAPPATAPEHANPAQGRSFAMRDRVVKADAEIRKSSGESSMSSSSDSSSEPWLQTTSTGDDVSKSESAPKRSGDSMPEDRTFVDLATLPTTPSLHDDSTAGMTSQRFWYASPGRLTASNWLVLIWIAGGTAVLIINLIRVARFQRLVHASTNVDSRLRNLVEGLAMAVGVRPPTVRISDSIESPVVWNAGGRSILLWPTSLPFDSMSRLDEYRGIVVHELAHLARRDHWYAWVEMIVGCVLWWNPLALLVRRNIRHYADLSCDAWVVSLFPDDRRTYAMCLIDAVERISLRSRFSSLPALSSTPAPALGFGETARRAFERRITMIARGNAVYRISPLLAAASLTCCALFLPTWAGGAIDDPATAVVDNHSIDPSIRKTIDIAMLERSAERLDESDSVEDAIAAYVKLVDIKPEAGEALSRLGYLYASRGQYDQAADSFRRETKTNHDPGTAYYNLACMLAVMGKKDQALDALADAVANGCDLGEHAREDDDLKSLRDDDQFNDLAEAMTSIAELTEKGDEALGDEQYIEAAVTFGKLSAIAPKVGKFHHLLAYASIMSGNLDAAEPAIIKQLALDYAPGIAMYNMACLRSLEGRTDDALGYLRKSIELGFGDPDRLKTDPDLTNVRETERFQAMRQSILEKQRIREEAELALKYEDWEKAADLFAKIAESAVSKNGEADAGWAYNKLGVARFYLGQYQTARDAFVNGIAKGAPAADGLYNIACCYGRMADQAMSSASAEPDASVAYYTVEAGDTLASISKSRYGASDKWKIIADANPSVGPDRLRVGQILRLPAENASGMSGSSAEFVAAGMEYLRQAVELGQDDPDHLRSDVDLGALRSSTEFEEIVQLASDQQVLELFGAVDWKHLEKKSARAIDEDSQDGGAYLQFGWAKLRLGEYEAARQAFMKQGELGTMPQIAWYNIACCYARAGDTDSAMQWLKKADADGMQQFDLMESDPDLQNLHNIPEFRKLVEEGRRHAAENTKEKEHDIEQDELDKKGACRPPAGSSSSSPILELVRLVA